MKTIVYRYNGDPASEEQEADIDNHVTLKEDDTIQRNGKRWKVTQINSETAVSVPRPFDVLRVFLVGPI